MQMSFRFRLKADSADTSGYANEFPVPPPPPPSGANYVIPFTPATFSRTTGYANSFPVSFPASLIAAMADFRTEEDVANEATAM